MWASRSSHAARQTSVADQALAAGIAIVLAGIALIAGSVLASSEATDTARQMNELSKPQWFVLWSLLAVVIVRRCLFAWYRPTPDFVQQAVRTCLRSIIVIDAAIVLGYCGPFWGCTVLALIIPMLA